MTPSPGIRRHPDGSIDVDHYRRAAKRERQDAMRRAFGRCAGAIAIIVDRSKRALFRGNCRRSPPLLQASFKRESRP